MHDEEPGNKPALRSSFRPALPTGGPLAPQGLDWKAFWNAVRRLIGGAKNLGEQLDATTQTPADDALLGKVGIITAKVAIGKAGEIRLPIRGGTQDYIACCKSGTTQSLDVNSTAEVVEFIPPNTVFVRPAG